MTKENDRRHEYWEERPDEDSYEDTSRRFERPSRRSDSPRPRAPRLPARGYLSPRQGILPGGQVTPTNANESLRARPRPHPRRPNNPYENISTTPRQRQQPPRPPINPREDEYDTSKRQRTTGKPREQFREKPGSYDDVYDRPQQQPRTSRHSREEAYARLRQRQQPRRQPASAPTHPSPIRPDAARSRQALRAQAGREEYSHNEPYDDEDYQNARSYAASAPRPRNRPPSDLDLEEIDRQARPVRTKPLPPRQVQRRQRGLGSTLLIGCIGGLVTIALIVTIIIVAALRSASGTGLLGGAFNQTYKQSGQQTFQIANLRLLQVHNQVGNVTITVDPNTNKPTLTYTKKVKASSSDAANNEFGRIIVSAQPADPALTVMVTFPAQSGNTSNPSDAVDLTISLPPPPGSGTNTNASLTLNVDTQVGDVNAQQVKLAASSCLQTNKGNVTFVGTLDTMNSSTLIPCNNTSTNNPHPWYTFHSEIGNVNVTLPGSINVILNASTIVGKINSNEYNLNIQNSGNSATYDNPLISNSTPPTAELKLDVGTGDINLHKLTV